MPIYCFETPESPTVGNDSVETRYTIQGTENELLARAALISTSSSYYLTGTQTLIRKSARVEPVDGDVWTGIVSYGERAKNETGSSSYQFDTGGGTSHITHSIKTVAKYAPDGQTAPDFKGAIGATLDNVEGVDIHIPIFHFSETHYIAIASVTEAYKHLIYQLTGTVNDAAFRGKARGEVLFLGAGGSQRGEDDWEITFKWAASQNRVNFAIGPITVASKEGWEYLWVRYQDTEDAASKTLVKNPIGAYVEQVYEYADFTDLGVG